MEITYTLTATYDGPAQAWSYATYRTEGGISRLPVKVFGDQITFQEGSA